MHIDWKKELDKSVSKETAVHVKIGSHVSSQQLDLHCDDCLPYPDKGKDSRKDSSLLRSGRSQGQQQTEKQTKYEWAPGTKRQYLLIRSCWTVWFRNLTKGPSPSNPHSYRLEALRLHLAIVQQPHGSPLEGCRLRPLLCLRCLHLAVACLRGGI